MDEGRVSHGVPLVIRVKRPADEEPMDVLRLRPLKAAKTSNESSAFDFENLPFKLAGTISDSEQILSKTAGLVAGVPSIAGIVPGTDGNASDGIEVGADPIAIARKIRRQAEAKKKNDHVFVISKKFRGVSMDGVENLVERLGNALKVNPQEEGSSLNSAGGQRGSSGAGSTAESSVGVSYVLCDLETVSVHLESTPRRLRKDDDGASGLTKSQITCNGQEMVLEKKTPDYVYDVYMYNPLSDHTYHNIYSCMDNMDVILGTSSENDFADEHDRYPGFVDEDDEDSNAEDNDRNDYPDEEDDSDSCGSESEEVEEEDIDPYEQDAFALQLHPGIARRLLRSKPSSSESSDDEM